MRLFCLLSVFFATVAAADDGARAEFARDILPVLADRCFACHGPDANQRKADLRLDLEKEAQKVAIVPGDAAASELIRRISSTDPDVRMPPPDSNREPLSSDQVAMIRAWIDEGAPWANHWSHAPPLPIDPPEISDPSWARNPIDYFIAARLKEAGLEPSPEASRETLVRRLSLDLTGLPPTLEMVDRFLADASDDAYERLIDRLLAASDYGENMAREWLDGARYADTNGYQNDFQRNMWPWRDWVIDAFNDNMPFNQFTVEQVAGDLLPNATDTQRIATGFNRNNRANTEGGSIEDEWRVENIVDRMETTGTVFLGLSIGCARCHDHKYDPISQQEFYEFFAFFNSSADKGFYEETRGNAGPIVSLPSFNNQVRISEFDHSIELVQAEINSAKVAQPFEYMAWRARLRRQVKSSSLPVPALAAALNDPVGLGEAVSSVDGLAAPAVALTGSPESMIDLGQAATFERDRPFTVSVWVKPEGPGAIFSKMDDAMAQRGVDLLVSEEGQISVHLVNAWPDDAIEVITAKNRVRTNVWAHVCVTYDGTSKPNGISVYVDGISAPLETEKSPLNNSIATDQPLRIGGRSSAEHFKGAIFDFRYFAQALDQTTALALTESTIHEALVRHDGDAINEQLENFFAQRSSFAVSDLQDQLQEIKKKRADYVSARVPTVMVMEELETPRPTYLLKRGAYDAPDLSHELHPGIPEFLPPLPEGAPPNRLGLAQWLVDPANPLTARVTVNRYWQMIFGRGLVKTVEDFGVQGEPPTHQELLDWLTTDFIASGWDVKHLLKRMVTSATYRQSSTLTDKIRSVDPQGTLLASAPRIRFPAEVVRDNALAVSGLLTQRIGGPSVKPYQPEGLWAELAGGAGEGPYVVAKGDDLYRRSLYIYRKRTVPPPSLTTFDSPGWDLCRVRRGRTNTPLQALALLNDVTYAEAARNLAQRMILEGGAEAESRIVHGFRLATGRRPTASELAVLRNGLDGYLQTFSTNADAAAALIDVGESPAPEEVPADRLAAYTSLASVIMNLDEVITRE